MAGDLGKCGRRGRNRTTAWAEAKRRPRNHPPHAAELSIRRSQTVWRVLGYRVVSGKSTFAKQMSIFQTRPLLQRLREKHPRAGLLLLKEQPELMLETDTSRKSSAAPTELDRLFCPYPGLRFAPAQATIRHVRGGC